VKHFTPQSNASSSSESLDQLSKGRAMTIRFDCQFCGKTLKADDSKAGKKVKCPSCEGLLSIPDLAVPSAVDLPAAEDLDDDSVKKGTKSAELATSKRTIPCPMCDEPISPRETTCPFCGEEIKAKNKRRSRGPIADPMKRFMGFLVDSLAGILFIAPGIGLILAGAAAAQDQPEPPMLRFSCTC
jgi:DNA-directed RNA polymerase subunit M/transcription elongation factor TFIIS